MPFVTERIYGILHEEKLLVLEDWPDAGQYQYDADAAKTMTSLVSAIRGIRNLRAEYKIAPAHRFPASFRADDRALVSRLQEGLPTLSRLAGISELKLIEDGSAFDEEDVTVLFTGGEIAIPLRELVNVEEELERMKNEEERLKQEISRAEAMLGNPNFTGKAPVHVVDVQREKKMQYEDQLESLIVQLERLKRLSRDD
jgi:valyl-tRNA synthetase